MDQRIAGRLRSLRAARNWSLDELAKRSGLSRATLSRLENAEVSPTAQALGKLCAAYGMTLSRLIHMVEGDYPPLLKVEDQPVWVDETNGFQRRSVSPPAQNLAGEVLECSLRPGTRIAYEHPPRPGLEHHLLLLEGALTVTVDGQVFHLSPGESLRYQLHGASSFTTPDHLAARYLLFMV